MNYKTASDFEINCLVANKITGKDHNFTSGSFCVRTGRPACICCLDTVVLKDYCNSWSDAGPIIERKFIGLRFAEEHDFNCWMAESTSDPSISWLDKNPLRAICIVFLMMEGE